GEPVSIPLTIYGTKGCIKGDILIREDGRRIGIEELFEKKTKSEIKDAFFPYGIKNPMALETLEFLKAIKEERDMETSGLEGLRDLAASYALIESSLMGQSIKVDDVETGKIGRYEEEINTYYSVT
ncbi:hypothetical protein KEJ17_08620, partial [Candidatus Bathyarchaeota archaeon]|nr:hypothetical protein [Candidatus Bathyarchaeota archaeon]